MVIFLLFVFICIIFKINAKHINNSFNKNLTITKKNVINQKGNTLLGVILNYDWKIIAPFFISFKKARFNNCDCVMFVENLTQETINKMESYNVTIFSKRYF